MRLVQVTIPTGKRETVRRALDDEGVDYVLTDETSGREFTAIAYFPLPQRAVEPVLERLREAGLEDDAFTVVIEASTVISRRFEELQQEYAEDGQREERIAREELLASAENLMPTTRNYLVLTVVSAVVATAGLLLDSAAVVVGSMVIAPLVGPALSASVGTVLGDSDLRTRGVILQVVGLLAAIVSAAVFSVFVQSVNVVPPGLDVLSIGQVRERLAPDILALVIALGAGVAGALSLSTGVSAALVGVMIAVALIPPAAVVGIGLAWMEPQLALGSSVLVLVNLLSINAAALAVLWYQGYRPGSWFRLPEARSTTITRIGVLTTVIVVLSLFLAGVTFAGYQSAVAEETIRSEAEAVVDDHQQLHLLGVQVERGENPLRGTPDQVIVTVGKSEWAESPPIAAELSERVQDQVGAGTEVEVRFIEVQRAGGGAADNSTHGEGDTPGEDSSTPRPRARPA